MEDIKIFLKKEKTKGEKKWHEKDIKILLKKNYQEFQYCQERNKNLSKEQKQKFMEYRRNYYIKHNN